MSQDDLYQNAVDTYGASLNRLARGYEADPDKQSDLLQEIHLALWRSFERYEARCSIKTWVYRVANHTAASHVIQQLRFKSRSLLSLTDIEASDPGDHVRDAEQRMALDRLMELIHRMKPLDRQLMLLYLEGLDAAAIGEITGISSGNVRTQIHRIKNILARRFHAGGPA